MDIRFYDANGNLRLSCNDYIKVVWEECLLETGECEIVFLETHNVLDLFLNEQALIAEYDGKQGLVTDYSIKGEYLSLTVKSLNALLLRRIIPQDVFSYYGAPDTLVAEVIKQYAPHINISAQEEDQPHKQISLRKPTLFDVVKSALKDTNIGLKISFSSQDKSFSASFIHPKTNYVRLSAGNRNLSDIICNSSFDTVKNAGYYTSYFIDCGTWKVGNRRPYNFDPNNFMKQYVAESDGYIDTLKIKSGQYIYCDTEDGELKVSDIKQEYRIRYMTLEKNPILVRETDLRDLNEIDVPSYLEQSNIPHETWRFVPYGLTVDVGEIVSVEKNIGLEKGLINMQVVSVKTDTSKPVTEVKLEALN
ncbi:MAG: hypothetical protein IKJ06_03745 [Clostridia bacterium]|nr:hypothetical protein [Clostridia bacterium]